MDLKCLMHQGTPYGYLRLTNKVIHKDNLVHILGANLEVIEPLLNELLDNEILAQDTDTGCYFYPDMIRKEEIRKKRAKGGKLGGNPALTGSDKVKQKVNLKDKRKVNQDDTPKVNQDSDNEYIDDNDINNNIDKTSEFYEEYFKKLKTGTIHISQFLEFSPQPELEEDAIKILIALKRVNCPNFNETQYLPKQSDITSLIRFLLIEDYSKDELLALIEAGSRDEYWKDKLSCSILINPENLNILQTKADQQNRNSHNLRKPEYTEHAVGEVVG